MQKLEDIRSSLITSIFGRRAGLDSDEFWAGPKDIRKQVLDLTTASTGTAIPNHGFVDPRRAGVNQIVADARPRGQRAPRQDAGKPFGLTLRLDLLTSCVPSRMPANHCV